MDISTIAAIIIGLVFLAIILNSIKAGLLIKAKSAGLNVTIVNILGMKFRMVDAKKIILPMIRAKEQGIDLEPNYVEAHYLAGGNIDNLVQILIDAQYECIDLSFEDACSINYKGYDFDTYKNEHSLSPKL